MVEGKFVLMMMKVLLVVAIMTLVVTGQGNEVPIQQQQQQQQLQQQQQPQGVPVQNQGQQQVQQQAELHQLNQQQQAQLQQQQKILVQQQQQQEQLRMHQQGKQATINNVPGGRNIIRDKKYVQDKEHIKLHLNGVIDQEEKDMSEKELELHYFKMHDYDNNMKLDGLEIMQAVSHFHHDGAAEDTVPLADDELMQLIDPILEEDDKNGDGYIDYPEFAANKV